MSSEERHRKQKEKLLAHETKEEKNYSPKPYFKQIVVNECNKNGFFCILNNDAVIVFSQIDKESEIIEWLMKTYGKTETVKNPYTGEISEVRKIPFSFGFADIKVSNIQEKAFTSTALSTEEE